MEQIILNLVPGGVSPVCYVSQYDVGRKIRLHLRNGSDPYVLSGAETVTATIRKVSGEELIYDIANTSASYVDLIVNYDATDVIGESVCELIITESGTRLGSANFKMRIDPDVYSGDQKLEVVSATSENPNLSFETNVEENLLELKAGFSPVQEGTPWIDSNEVNKVPYIKRAVAGTATRIGNHLYDKLVGGTVAFNQLIEKDTNKTNGNLTISTNASTKKVTLNLSADGGSDSYWSLNDNVPIFVRINHKYIILLNNYIEENAVFCIRTTGTWKTGSPSYDALRDTGHLRTATILNASYDGGYITLMIDTRNPYTVPTSYPATAEFFPQIIDLTAMFGSTIADYIYSLEQATAGAGVAWFKALFPNDYYAYNAGEFMSVKATAHVMKNASNTVIGNYALDSNLELRGLFKLDANNKLYADGDTYESSGAVGRRYSTDTLFETLDCNWNYQSSYNYWFIDGADYVKILGAIGNISDSLPADVLALNYPVVSRGWFNSNRENLPNKCIAFGASGVTYLRDTSIASTSYNGAKPTANLIDLVYLKATPTTEQASPFTNPQVCDENGTEEYTDSRAVVIPVGHETYQANICPISGFTEANITRCGVNLVKFTEASYTNSGITCNVHADNSVEVLNTSTATISFMLLEGSIKAGSYILSGCEGGNLGTYAFRIRDKNNTSNYVYSENGDSPVITFAQDTEIQLQLFVYGTTTVNKTFNIMLRKSTSASEFHAYNGQTYAIAFGQTVYGGVLDVTRGKLHVTRGIVDLGDLSYAYNSSSNTFVSTGLNSVAKFPGSASVVANIICDSFISKSLSALNYDNENGVALGGSSGLSVKYLGYTDASTFPSVVSGMKLVYELATPFDIDLTPKQIEALLGINNVWHDGNGGTEVKFFRLIPAS